ncbi:MAG: phosphoglucosamine mutase [Oscillospiraceae bacterium]
MGRIFGTDGARGIANTEISCKLAMNLGRAAAMVVAEQLGRQPTVLVGKDTRISSDMLEAAITAGLCSVGANAVQIGVVPTPAVAHLITAEHADAGIMLSASHNSYEFNGIKIFGAEGYKLTDEQEFEIEEIVLDKVKPYLIRWGWELGRITRDENLVNHYIDHVAQTVQGDFSGFKVALDCSNGSASSTAEKLFGKLGVQMTLLGCDPNGININRDCGSTHIESLAEFVAEGGYDAGFAFDGDADRCIAVDEKGSIVDGDVIMAILATDRRARALLNDDTIVATVMSNLGLFRFAEKNGFRVEKTKVGDRYVLRQMRRKGYNLGGEQSGHVILSDYMSTGDGQLTACHVLQAMANSDKSLSELAAIMPLYPQVMRNIRADAVMKSMLDVDEGAAKIIEEAKEELGDEGRILVRASGTEPLIRVMIEGMDKGAIDDLLCRMSERLEERLSQNEEYKMQEGF